MLGSRIAGYWKMDGSVGVNEPDEEGSNDLTQYNNVGAGSTGDFSFRTLNGSDQRFETPGNGDLDAATFRTWIAFPFRPDDIQSGRQWVFNFTGGGSRGILVKVENGSFLFRVRSITSDINGETLPATESEFQVVQMWNDPERGETGIRVSETESVFDTVIGGGLDTRGGPLVIGSQSGGGRHVDGAIGPLLWAEASPTPADRDWLYNGGSFRTLSEIQNRTVTVRDI
jgi:hypothetical protein